MRVNKDTLSLKWFLCLLFRRHKWGYYEAGGKYKYKYKYNYNCSCGVSGCSPIPVYDLVCSRCGLQITLGEDELIDCFAKRLKE